ncbi:eukaryotic elongation factor 2 kinase-like isoform X2 [Amphibalanus amphitrite]|uniref:eukaryotic elongation factor 2 kinase-like isoform X2 n=1 Tax=Amphibalanus amphitrite TaxID=1232801 RepID=UPI001C9267AD|nr:eukaryotic elongation factor 2 kinase-like isoform X2 [Amphibalanus amphitrite]
MPESQDASCDGPTGHLELSQELDQIDLCPITLDDIKADPHRPQIDESEIIEWKQRDHFATGKRKRPVPIVIKTPSTRQLWNRAISKANSLGDSWENFDVEGLKTEKATRYRYKALTGTWVTDEVSIKMEPEHFNAGAMRRCFRAKKLSNFCHHSSWHRESNNYVAKAYMVPVDRRTYFDDVKLQMEAKLWSEEYNRHNPPKKVDIMQMCVVEMTERPDKPLYHFEHFIDGSYVKYNSNSGFVRDENLRLTPQAFSHFTFERSGHELVVVDIQGVGDLYTDPQIHTADGESYGDGNLGTRGMALFFHSHVCNTICHSLNLTAFDLAPTESKELSTQIKLQQRSKTLSRGLEEVCASPREHEFDLHEYMRRRSSSSGHWSGDEVTSPLEASSPPQFYNELSDSARDSAFIAKRTRFISESSTGSTDANDCLRFQSCSCPEWSCPRPAAGSSPGSSGDGLCSSPSLPERPPHTVPSLHPSGRSHPLLSQGGGGREAERALFQEVISNKQRPSNIEAEVCRISTAEAPSILGQIHFDLAKYHEVGRFLGEDKTAAYDRSAGMFHLERAVDCGVREAIITLADICLGRPHDLLSDVQLEDSAETRRRGISLLERAAQAGDRAAMVDLARSYELGTYLPAGEKDIDWNKAVHWYALAADTDVDESAVAEDPTYLLMGRCAEMLKAGGPRLEPDYSRAAEVFNSAAEKASAAMKGRAANRYFMEAEECWALAEGDGEGEGEE